MGGGQCYPWSCTRRKGKGKKQEMDTRGQEAEEERQGSICGLGLLFAEMDLAKGIVN